MLTIINLEEGLPTVEEARQRMLREMERARRAGAKGAKLIHGYGSSGEGGDIRLSVGRALQEMRKSREVKLVIFGENWAISDPDTWALLKTHPKLKQDEDLGRKNRGITIVWF